MENWIKSAKLWHPALKKSIEKMLLECTCKVAHEPTPHPIVSQNPPARYKQTYVSIDVVFIEGVPIMHVVDKCIGYSETGILRRRALDAQLATFLDIWIYRHGIPLTIHADREYFKGVFYSFCSENGITLAEHAANDHEANGTVERANRTLKSFFRRIRSDKPKSSVSEILREATYAKNICKGSKLASSFELLYCQKPRIIAEHDVVRETAITLDEHVADVAKKRVNDMVNSKPRKLPTISVGDYAFFWRDDKRWIGPGKVVHVGNVVVKIVYGEKTWTSSRNRLVGTETVAEDCVGICT